MHLIHRNEIECSGKSHVQKNKISESKVTSE